MSERTLLNILCDQHRQILLAMQKLHAAVSGDQVDTAAVKEFLRFTEEFAEPHHQAEEKILFPVIVKKGFAAPVAVMLREHEQKRLLIAHLRLMLYGGDGDGIDIRKTAKQIIVLLKNHIAKEDHVLYPKTALVLNSEEKDELLRQYDQLFGSK